jgi:type IV secretory pathway component VirB8
MMGRANNGYADAQALTARALNAEVLALEDFARRAGAAMACSYSSSEEFDAALIAERRAAGVYGPRRHRKQMLASVAGIATGLAVIIMILMAV